MGIGIVLIAFAVAGAVIATIGALMLGSTAALLTRGAHGSRKGLIVVASVFPLVCLGWAGAIFIFQAVTNEFVFHRDPGLGDTWTCPLPNGFALLMIDTTDQGWLYNPKTQPNGVSEQEDAVGGVVKLQVAGQYVLGGSDARPLAQSFDDSPPRITSYFLMDARFGKHTTFPSYEALQAKARELGITLNLEPIAAVYGRYRFTWFDVFTLLLLLLPPLAGFVLLLRWTIRVRRTRSALLPA